MFRRKMQKAKRGEYLGEPIPPGYFLPISGRKPSGEFVYGKMEPYPPHAEIVKQVLEKFVSHGGSRLKTLRALNGITFPFFPPDLQYMERLTSLRRCPKAEVGYKITSTLIRRLVTNPKMIGIWQWGETEPIVNNHAPVAPEELFLKAWQLANDNKKSKGRTVNFEPMEWAGLLYCMSHSEPRKIASLSSKGRYTCQRDYVQEASSVCLDITARFIDEPLTTTVLNQLDFTPFTEEILAGLESEDSRTKLEERQARQQVKNLEEEISNWQSLLPCCVDNATGIVDKEKEAFYWDKIRNIQEQLDSIKTRPIPRNMQDIDFNKVREFLKDLTDKWYTYSLTSRNQLLKSIIESVELRGSQDIEATINWKTGFQQKVIIHRPVSNSKLEKRWTKEEDGLLRMMYPSSSADALVAAIPNRTWKAITLRARRLYINRIRSGVNHWRKWTREEDEKLNQLCRDGVQYSEIAHELGRSLDSVATRVRDKGWSTYCPNGTRKSRVHWEASQLLSL